MQFLDTLDKEFSLILHNLDSKVISLILYPFARIFNPDIIIIPISFIFVLAKFM